MQIVKVNIKDKLVLLCRKFCSICICSLIIINIKAFALIKENLYSIDIKVESKDIDITQRNQLTEQAFAEVLQKITAKPKTLEIKDFDKYLSKYFYNQTSDNQTTLTIFFDQKAIHQDLINNKYKFLGEHRPLTIVWPKSLGLTNNQELLDKIVVTAKSNGLSIIYPMLDLIDLKLLNQSTDEQQLIQLIKQASKRYSADEIIFVESNKSEEVLRFSWKSVTSNWQIETNEPDVFVQNLMDNFIKRYALNKDKETIFINIVNVINLEDYVRVENYLQNLSFVKNLQATKFQAGEVEFEVLLNGDKEAVRSAIANSSILRENHNKNLDQNVLSYSLQM